MMSTGNNAVAEFIASKALLCKSVCFEKVVSSLAMEVCNTKLTHMSATGGTLILLQTHQYSSVKGRCRVSSERILSNTAEPCGL